VSRRLTAAGVAGVAIGLGLLGLAVLGSQSGSNSSSEVWTLVAILGGVVELLGACAIAPAFVARLEPVASHTSGARRIAARSLARQRSRSGGVISAVAAAGALAVAASAIVLGAEEADPSNPHLPHDVVVAASYESTAEGTDPLGGSTTATTLPMPVVQRLEPPSERLASTIDRIVGDNSSKLTVRVLDFSSTAGTSLLPTNGLSFRVRSSPYDENEVTQGYERAVIADPALLRALHLGEVEDELDEFGIVLVEGYSTQADVTLPDGQVVRGAVVDSEYSTGLADVLVSPAKARDLTQVGEVRDAATLYDLPHDLTGAQRDQLAEIYYDAEYSGLPLDFELTWRQPEAGPTPFQLELIMAGASLLFALFVVGSGLALAAAESRDERDVLTIAGAGPRTMARAAGSRAWMLSLLGAGLAVPVGFLPVVVFTLAYDSEFPIELPLVFPIRTVLLLALAVPLVAAVVAWAVSAAALRLRPVRVSTATFE
jgi:hypothetical protein